MKHSRKYWKRRARKAEAACRNLRARAIHSERIAERDRRAATEAQAEIVRMREAAQRALAAARQEIVGDWK